MSTHTTDTENPLPPSEKVHRDAEVDDMMTSLKDASFSEVFSRFFRGALCYEGKASRREYWIVTLVWTVLTVIAGAVLVHYSTIPSPGPNFDLTMLVSWITFLIIELIMVIFFLPLTIRRLRDAGFHWWIVLLSFIPLMGFMVMMILCAMPSYSGGKRRASAKVGNDEK